MPRPVWPPAGSYGRPGCVPEGRTSPLITWRHGKQWTGLYRIDLAQPKRTPTLAQRRALASAMAARRRCRTCGKDAGYWLPTSIRRCWDCDKPATTDNTDLAA